MIVVATDDVRRRVSGLGRLLRPLTGGRDLPVFQAPGGTGTIFGVGDRNSNQDVREVRVRSRCPGIFMNCVERWDSIAGGRSFCLRNAYLHLFIRVQHDHQEEEIIALHCDPMLTGAEDVYKRGPHIHLVSLKAYNLHHAHIALCLGSLNAVCSDVRQFDDALRTNVKMIDVEFVGRIQAYLGD